MHQAMAKALVRAQRRATAPQSTGTRRERRPCTDSVPCTAPQSAVPMDNGATGAVGARNMIAALQRAASRSARGGSRKVPASTQAPATAITQPSIQPMPSQPTPAFMPNHLVVLRVGPQKDQQRSRPKQWRHGVQHQRQQRQQTPPPKPTQAPPHLRHIQRRQSQADALLKHVPPCNYQRALGMSDADFENANGMAQLRLELRDRLADAKGNLQACRTTLTTLRNYLVERDRLPRTARFIEGTVSDYYLGAYLTNVTDSATGRKTRRVALEKLRDSCGFCFDVGLEAKKKIPNLAPAKRHAKLLQSGAVPKGKPALEPREQRHTAQFADRMIGPSGVSGPPGDVTGVGGAAIVKRRLLRVEESVSSPNEAPS